MATRVHHHRQGLGPLDPQLVLAWAGVPTTIAADLFRGAVLADPAVRPLRPFGPGERLAGTAVTAW